MWRQRAKHLVLILTHGVKSCTNRDNQTLSWWGLEGGGVLTVDIKHSVGVNSHQDTAHVGVDQIAVIPGEKLF